MPTAYAISVAAAALALNPNDAAAREAMARALARAGITANNNDTNTPEERNEASTALWRLTGEEADNTTRAEDTAVCSNYIASHTPTETAQTIRQLCEAVRAAKRADLRRYFQRYCEQVIANEPSDDDRHQEEASNQARDFSDPTDPEEVKSAIDAIESANDTARWLFDLDEYESAFGEIGPPKKKRGYYSEPEGNDLPSTFRDMLRAVAESLDFEAISKRNAPDRDECARMLWDRIESELTDSATDEEDRQTWLDKIAAAWPDLDTEGLAEPLWDAAHEDDEDEDEDSDDDEESESTAADDIAAAIAPRAFSFGDNNGDNTP